VKNIREQGFDVLLMLEATIGLNEVEEETPETDAADASAEGPFTHNDLSFLKSLRISLPDAEPEGGPGTRKALPPGRPDGGARGDPA